MSIHAPEYIRALVPYVPGKPIEETQREFKIKKVIKLASNENPLGPSPKAMRVIQKAVKELHRYPDASAFHLKEGLSKYLKVPMNHLIVGNGSNEVIDMLIRTYCVPGDSIVTSKAAFIAYRICAQIHGVTTLESELDSGMKADLKSMAALVRKYDRVKMVFLANPNNPTGTFNTKSEINQFLKEVATIRDGSVMVVLDYAYWEYVTSPEIPDPESLRKKFSNVVILRTFSKVFGLAGLRVGYGIADPEIISTLEKVKQPFNMNSLALTAATEALKDKAFIARSRKTNQAGMKLWTEALKSMGVPYWESQGNFILIDTLKGLGKRGGDVYENCLRRGVIFRPVSNYGLMHALRISIGTPEENKVAIAALKKELPGKKK
jgi:histidinol-phosphate aminotransferase